MRAPELGAKCSVMNFSLSSSTSSSDSIGNDSIKPVNKQRDLGITITNNLSHFPCLTPRVKSIQVSLKMCMGATVVTG